MRYVRAVKIAKGLRVMVKVELAIVGGESLEKSSVEYIHGGGTMLPGIEAVLEGLEKGAKRDGVLKAKDAFGNPAMHPTKKMARSEFPKDAKLVAGERFQAKGVAGGMDVVLQLEKVGDAEVEVKLVHPLADKDIKYSVEVLQVSDPKPPPMPAAALHLEEDKS
jgi:FKBP-type peptidyl-prolyl cis-trans isomerase 2